MPQNTAHAIKRARTHILRRATPSHQQGPTQGDKCPETEQGRHDDGSFLPWVLLTQNEGDAELGEAIPPRSLPVPSELVSTVAEVRLQQHLWHTSPILVGMPKLGAVAALRAHLLYCAPRSQAPQLHRLRAKWLCQPSTISRARVFLEFPPCSVANGHEAPSLTYHNLSSALTYHNREARTPESLERHCRMRKRGARHIVVRLPTVQPGVKSSDERANDGTA